MKAGVAPLPPIGGVAERETTGGGEGRRKRPSSDGRRKEKKKGASLPVVKERESWHKTHLGQKVMSLVSLAQGSGSESSVLAGSVDELGLTGSAIGEEKRPGGRKVE